jgi:stage II sporulation protein D
MTKLRRKIAVCVSVLAFTTSAFAVERVRVSVFGLFHPKQITVESKQPLLVKAGEREFVLEPGQTATMSSADGKVIVEGRSAAERILVAPRDGGEAEFYLAVPGKIRRMYRGQVAVVASGKELVPVVSMELETAVASVNAAEATPGATIEALKAQAVAIRSYLVAGKPRHAESDFCDTTHCQFLKSPPAKESLAAQAAEATRGLVLAWQGKPFAAMYSASCAGRTHSLAGIGYTVRDYPYFAVECAYCRRNPERWTATVSREDAAALASKSEAERIKLARKLGWNTVQSNDHSAKSNGTMVDLAGVGRGHGLGLCQRGAAGMAREGKSFREILMHYYPNAELKSGVSSF